MKVTYLQPFRAVVSVAACLGWFSVLHLPAQDLYLERLSSELGLSQNMINCVAQDSKGFLWVGTKDGLNRFDGYRFVTYRYDPFDSLSLSNNTIHHILEDRAGRMWVVTSEGMNLFDREKELFYPLKIPVSTFNLCEDPAGNLWQGGTGKGLLKITLPPADRTLDNVTTTWLAADDLKPGGTGILSPVWDATGQAWVGKTDRALWRLRTDPAGSYALNRDFSDLPNAEGRNFLSALDSATSRFYNWVEPGRDGKIWLSNYQHLCSWNTRTGQLNAIPVPQEFIRADVTGGHNWDYFSSVVEDQRGRLWLGGFAGTFRVSLADKKVQALVPENAKSDYPLFYGTGAILEDQGGLIWFGTRGNGLFKLNDNARRFAPGLWKGESIRSLCQTTDGRLWVAPNAGWLYWLDPHTRALRQVAAQKLFFGRDIGAVTDLYQSKDGALWVGSGNWGLLKITNWQSNHPQLEAFHPGPDRADYTHLSPKKIVEDAAGMLWSVSSDALQRLDPRTGVWERFVIFPDFQSADANYFPSLLLDRRGYLWCGSNSGLFRFDPVSKAFQHYLNDRSNPNSLSHNQVKSLLEDPTQPERYLWVGTGGGGLNRLDTETGVFEKFTEKDGLPDLVVYGILPDAAGHLWLSTNKGLSVFDPQRRSFRNFDQRDGLQNLEFNTAAYHRASDGQLFFGGIEGFNAFYPTQMLQSNAHVPQVVFTDFKIANRSVSHKTPGSPLTVAIAYATRMVLPADVKIFSFDFAALDFAEPSKNQFACKMEGFDSDWQFLGTAHSATYTNLSPGTYTFRVRGSNNDGVWNDTGTSIEIVILAPWWATWWAWAGYLFGAGWVLFAFFQLQKKRDQAKAETQRLQDLNDAKSQFLSTVSHELRTPLTSILGFSKIIQKRLEERILPNLDRSDPKTDRAAEQVMGNLGIVVSESERLTSLINDVLDLAKIESGKAVWHEERVSVADLVEHAAAATATLFEQKHLQLRLDVAPDLPDTLGDPNRLLQVMVNLLSNAVKFTERGTVTCSAKLMNTNTLLLSVADTGVGVPPEFREIIFEKFRQVTSDTLTDKPQGTGLGLPICKEIVEHHGGQIWLESEPGVGSVFSFTVPVRL